MVKGDGSLGISFIILVSDIDNALKDCKYYQIEVFLKYISNERTAVQMIKRFPDLLRGQKFSQGKCYVESLENSLEVFNTIEYATNLPGYVLLASVLESVYKFNDMDCISINFTNQPEAYDSEISSNIKSKSKSKKCPSLKNTQKLECKDNEKVYSRRARTSVPQIKMENLGESAIISKFEIGDYLIQNQNCYEISDELRGFKESKDSLLSQFFNRMSKEETDEEKEKEKEKEVTTREISEKITVESERVLYDSNSIKVKSVNRSISNTPRSLMVKQCDEKVLLSECALHSNTFRSSIRTQESKIKKIILGTRFFRKIDERFVQMLSEKMKKDTKELKRLKASNKEEYTKKRHEFLQVNKEKWVKEVLESLRSNEVALPSSENDSHQQVKHEALCEYLNQEKNFFPLISKAEHIELGSRKL